MHPTSAMLVRKCGSTPAVAIAIPARGFVIPLTLTVSVSGPQALSASLSASVPDPLMPVTRSVMVPFPVPVWVPGAIVALLMPVRIPIPVMPAIFVHISVMPSSSVISPSVAPLPVMPAIPVVILTTHESTYCAASIVRLRCEYGFKSGHRLGPGPKQTWAHCKLLSTRLPGPSDCRTREMGLENVGQQIACSTGTVRWQVSG